MSKSIRISDELAAEAEAAGAVAHRSPPQQIEHWAQIGRVIEPALSYSAEVKLKQADRSDLDSILNNVETGTSIRRTRSIVRKKTGRIESDE